MHQYHKCRSSSDRDETVNYVMSGCSTQEQKEYKTRHVWSGVEGDPLGIVQEKKHLIILTDGICSRK